MFESCAGFKDDLSSLLDNELDDLRRARLTSHLTECDKCRHEYEDIKAVSRLIAQSPQSLAVPDLLSGLTGRLPGVCEVIGEDLSAYIDGELPGPAQEGINQHLKECSGCRDRFRKLNATNEMVSAGLALPASLTIDLWPAVKARLNEDCALIQSELSAFVDQEVATLHHRSITSHLLDCPTCRAVFDELTQVADVLRTAYQPVLPDTFDLWPEIKAKMQVVPLPVKTRPKSNVAAHRLYLVGAAAVVAGVLGALAFFVYGPTHDAGIRPVSAEAYLLESALAEPADSAEAVVYESQ